MPGSYLTSRLQIPPRAWGQLSGRGLGESISKSPRQRPRLSRPAGGQQSSVSGWPFASAGFMYMHTEESQFRLPPGDTHTPVGVWVGVTWQSHVLKNRGLSQSWSCLGIICRQLEVANWKPTKRYSYMARHSPG